MLKASSVEHIAKLHSRRQSSRKRSMHVTGHFTKTEVSIRTHPDTRRQARPWKKLLHTEGEQDGTGPRRRRQARPRRASCTRRGNKTGPRRRRQAAPRLLPSDSPWLVLPHDNFFQFVFFLVERRQCAAGGGPCIQGVKGGGTKHGILNTTSH